MDNMDHPNADYDTPWKEALEYYFQDFMALFFPKAHTGIDWQRGYEFLDKELAQIVRDAELGQRRVDKLVRVWRLSGEEAWVLVHIEIQGNYDNDFAKRMYVYNYRLFDRYDRQVASFAVLTDEHPDWRPREFRYELWDSESSLKFPLVKLFDYRQAWQALETSENRFATVVMAHLKAQETKHDLNSRYHWKYRLIRQLYIRGYPRQDILELFRFIDWLLALPEALERSLISELEYIEENQKMPYVTNAERFAIEKGLQQGELQGEKRLLQRQMQRRFGPLPEAITERLAQADVATLEIWGERLLDATTLDEVFENLPSA